MSDRGALYDESYARDFEAALLAITNQTGGASRQGHLATALAADVGVILAGLDLPEIARAVLVERIARRLRVDSAVTVMAMDVMLAWHEEDEPPTWQEILPEVAKEANRQLPLMGG